MVLVVRTVAIGVTRRDRARPRTVHRGTLTRYRTRVDSARGSRVTSAKRPRRELIPEATGLQERPTARCSTTWRLIRGTTRPRALICEPGSATSAESRRLPETLTWLADAPGCSRHVVTLSTTAKATAPTAAARQRRAITCSPSKSAVESHLTLTLAISRRQALATPEGGDRVRILGRHGTDGTSRPKCRRSRGLRPLPAPHRRDMMAA